MTLDQLIYFHEAAKQEHFGNAAKALRITASAVSHAVAALEEELGAALFTRRGKNVALTERGRALRERAARVIEEVTALRTDLGADAQPTGHWALAGSHDLADRVLARAWAGIARRHTRLTADIFSFRSSDVLARVVEGTIDVGVCFSPLPHPEIVIEPLTTGQLRIACRAGHPLLRASRVCTERAPTNAVDHAEGVQRHRCLRATPGARGARGSRHAERPV